MTLLPYYKHPLGPTHLTEGDPFYLQIETPVAGAALCLRGWRRHWFLQPLSSAITVPVEIGRQWLTRNIHLNSPELISILGRQESTKEPEPIFFKLDAPFADFAVIVASATTVAQIVNLFDSRYPLERQYLDALPDIIRSSASKWFIASLRLQRSDRPLKLFLDQ